MLSTPYRVARVEHVRPGYLIEHDKGPHFVDEKRETADGFTLMVWPAHRVGQGKRVQLNLRPSGEVVVLPSSDELLLLVAELRSLVRYAAKAWEQQHHVEGRVDQPAAPWRAEDDTIKVQVAGQTWSLPFTPQALGIDPPDDDGAE